MSCNERIVGIAANVYIGKSLLAAFATHRKTVNVSINLEPSKC